MKEEILIKIAEQLERIATVMENTEHRAVNENKRLLKNKRAKKTDK